MPKFYFLLLALFCFSESVQAQEEVNVAQILDSLQYGAELPSEILQTKSLVLVKVPPKSTQPYLRGSWKKLAEQAQPGFKRAGIDAVVYYYVEDIYSGKEPYLSFMEDFKKRGLENIIFLVQEAANYRIVLTKMNDGDPLIKSGQQAWQTQHADLAMALNNLYKAAANSAQARENLLILEVPEFGTMTSPIKGRRGEYYDLNFSSERLAIVPFADTAQINQVMADYPYKYGFVDANKGDTKLRSDGYQYILYYVHTTGKEVKEMLGYNTTDTETAYVSEVVKDGQVRVNSYSIDIPVYKFYIKHIYSGNVFLGKKWDAAPTWQQALTNYIDNLRNELVRK
ncbi:NTPase [Fulvivirga imtechensis AK7]|uniref:NTPase n=1 Tax=Fulvivirga imtechensis AK7 TaxID=1237149 RepID=L8JR38_9BACT|nr:hypothetical protein [Fulvivirga imtechensis]ELR69797.1 NTPase [Fulvivirga imtechensis AK7]